MLTPGLEHLRPDRNLKLTERDIASDVIDGIRRAQHKPVDVGIEKQTVGS
jgi:hypothetical protein